MEDKFILNESILSSVLQVNNIDISTLRENQKKTNYFKTLPSYSPLLLNISCNFNNIYSSEVSLNAAIQLKNYIKSYWKNDAKEIKINNEDTIIINQEDKSYIRNKLLEAIIYIIEIENKTILKQYNQCIQTILKYDFKKNLTENKDFINKIIACLSSKNLKQIYAGIILFGQLSKIFEFDNEESQKLYNDELIKVNNYLLLSLYECKNINEITQANFAYKIIKIFFRGFQGAVPELFIQENIFEKWINFIVNIIKTPIDENNINKGENQRKNIFYKLKRVCYQTVTRIIQKYSRYLSKKEQTPFEKMINDKYIKVFFDLYKTIFINQFNNKIFIDDYGKTCIYNFFSTLMDNKEFNHNIIELFIKDENNILLNNIINDCVLTYQDLELWHNDPKKYLAEKMEIMNDFLTKRYNSCKLFISLWKYKDKQSGKYIYYQTLYDFLCKVLINETNNINIEKQNLLNNLNNKPYYLIYNQINFCLRKESILYIIKSNFYYVLKFSRNTFEDFVEKIIYPEFGSSCAFLREQACNFIKEFRGYEYTNKILIENITKGLSYLMQNDPVLQVRFESAMALSSILKQKYVKDLLKGNILPLLKIYIKLMEETDLEEIMNSLQEVVQIFTEESKTYIVHLSEYLNKYFNNLVNNISNNEEEEQNEISKYSLINNIINTFCNFIHYFVNDEEIYPKIESYIDNLIHFCINIYPDDKLEDGIGLMKEILTNCKKLPNHILKFFIPIINIIIEEKDSDLYGNENISNITQIICYYISKDFDDILMKPADKEGKYQYLFYVIKFLKFLITQCDKEDNDDFYEYTYIFNLCNVLFDRYKNKIENIFIEILELIISKYKNTKNKNLLNYIGLLLSTCFIYFPENCLIYFQKKCCLKDIFMFWFFQIDKIKNFKHFKYNLFAICSLITLNKNQQDKLILDNINLLVDKIMFLIEKIHERIQKEEKEEKAEKKEKNEEEENEDELDGDDLFKKLIVEGKDISDDEDDDDWEEDEDEDEFPETEADKQDPILIVKNSLEIINKTFPELFDNIVKLLGNNVNKLKEIFSKREEQIKNNTKK
jgi:hypothetical protein